MKGGGLFRREAMEHLHREREGGGVPRVAPPRAWGVFRIGCGAAAAALGLALFGKVEVTSRGRGRVLAAVQEAGGSPIREGPLHVVAFLPEKDRAFVSPGDGAKLEVDPSPTDSPGTLPLRVERVADHPASFREVREILGDSPGPGAAYPVELSLGSPHGPVRVRPGMAVSVRFTLRRERPIALLRAFLARRLK